MKKSEKQVEKEKAVRLTMDDLRLSAEECAKALKEFGRSCNKLSIKTSMITPKNTPQNPQIPTTIL